MNDESYDECEIMWEKSDRLQNLPQKNVESWKFGNRETFNLHTRLAVFFTVHGSAGSAISHNSYT